MTINQAQQLLEHSLKALEADDPETAIEFVVAAQDALDIVADAALRQGPALVQGLPIEPEPESFDSVFMAEFLRYAARTDDLLAGMSQAVARLGVLVEDAS